MQLRSGGDHFDPELAVQFGSGGEHCLQLRSGGDHSDPKLAVRVRREALRSSACS